jgi:hypothetical protein
MRILGIALDAMSRGETCLAKVLYTTSCDATSSLSNLCPSKRLAYSRQPPEQPQEVDFVIVSLCEGPPSIIMKHSIKFTVTTRVQTKTEGL